MFPTIPKSMMSKTYALVDAEWILRAPFNWRKPFRQGLCDGDGCASIKSIFVSIATSANSEFFIKLLDSFGVKAHRGDGAVAVNSQESVLKCNQVQIFRYSDSRKNNLRKMSEMIETFDHSRKTTRKQSRTIAEMRERDVVG